MTKMRIRFCWLCGKQLYGNHSAMLKIDGHLRTLHKACDKAVKSGTHFIKKEEEWVSLNWELIGSDKF